MLFIIKLLLLLPILNFLIKKMLSLSRVRFITGTAKLFEVMKNGSSVFPMGSERALMVIVKSYDA